MNSIKFDSTELRNTTYTPRYAKHESAPERFLQSMGLALDDGEVLVSDRLGIKEIQLTGIITGSSQDDLESKIDAFKELMSRPEKNLDVEWNGSTRRYVATCKRGVDFDRDHFHLNFCPWTAVMVVFSGEGKETTTTKALDEEVLVTTNPVSKAFTISGSKPPKPIFTIQGQNFSAQHKGIEIKDTDTGEKIVHTRNMVWGSTDSIVVNCLTKTVTDNLAFAAQRLGDFYGVFPKMKIGTNTIQITLGGIVNQETSETSASDPHLSSSTNLSTTDRWRAQSFMIPYSDDTFKGLTLVIEKIGTPTDDLTIEIQTDDGNKSSGSVVTNATIIFDKDDIGAKAYYTAYSADLFSLSANTKYWIVAKGAGVDAGNYYMLHYGSDLYDKGNYSLSNDGGSTWTDLPASDLPFKLRYGGRPDASSVKLTVEYTKTYL